MIPKLVSNSVIFWASRIAFFPHTLSLFSLSSCCLIFHATPITVKIIQCAAPPPFPHMLHNDMSDVKADDRPAESIQSPPYLVHLSNVPDEEQPLLYGQNHESQRTHTNINITIVIACIACTTAISGVNAGMVTVAIPQIALDLNLDASQALWYVFSKEAKRNPVLDYHDTGRASRFREASMFAEPFSLDVWHVVDADFVNGAGRYRCTIWQLDAPYSSLVRSPTSWVARIFFS